MSKLVTITNILGSLGTNCYTIVNQDTREAAVVDPAARADYLVKMYEEQNIKLKHILLTHGHVDHIGGVEGLKKALPEVKVYASSEEADVLKRPELNLSMMFGSSMSLEADELIDGEPELELLGTKVKCIHVPGHTKGGMCYYFPEEKLLFSGDTLFNYSIGRSDFPTLSTFPPTSWNFVPVAEIFCRATADSPACFSNFSKACSVAMISL